MELLADIDCTRGKHFDTENFVAGLYCAAFPDGIPGNIATGKRKHIKPYRGDHGIRFEEDDALINDDTAYFRSMGYFQE